jgi:lysozyme
MARQKNTIKIQELPSFFPTQNFIKREENLELTAYICPAGVKTIGWGHAVEPRDGLKLGDTITEDEALRFLESDVIKAYQALFRLVHVPLTDNRQTALVSFIFNLGAGRFQASTLRQKINRREFDAAAQEFGRWVYARHPIKGMMKLRGLMSRRRREAMLFLGEIAQSPPPKARQALKHRKSKSSRLTGTRPSLWQKAAAVCVAWRV